MAQGAGAGARGTLRIADGRADGSGTAEVAASASPNGASAAVEAPATGGSGKRKKGKGMAWTEDERVALCKAWKAVTQSAETGTDMTKEELWRAVWRSFAALTPNEHASKLRGRWGSRVPSALANEWERNVSPSCQRFAHFYRLASRGNLTGGLTEDNVIHAAMGLYSGTGAYEAVRRDAEKGQDLRVKGQIAPVRSRRRVKVVSVRCWKELRTLDKFSGAAACNLVAVESSDDETANYVTSAEEDNDGQRRLGLKRPVLQKLPVGSKATKRARADERAERNEEARTAAALATIAAAVNRKTETGRAFLEAEEKRMAMAFFERPENEHTSEAQEFREEMRREMLEQGRQAIAKARARRAADAAAKTDGVADSSGALLGSSSISGTTAAAPRRGGGAAAMAVKRREGQVLMKARDEMIDLTCVAAVERAHESGDIDDGHEGVAAADIDSDGSAEEGDIAARESEE